ncbi:MAG: transglutaminase domain-containing protein, partial [Eubacterium sp.]|nr:transglutaminase domain-containing protein [Eubacterium sp.]
MTGLIYESLYVLTAAAGILSLFFAEFGFKDIDLFTVIIQFIITGIIVVFKRAKWLGRFIIIGVIIIPVTALIIMSGDESVAAFISDNIRYIWLPVVAVTAFILGELMTAIRSVRIVVSIASIGWMTVGTVLGHSFEKLFVAAAFMIILMTVIEEVQRRWRKSGYTDQTGHVVYVAPFILITILIVLMSPAPDKPYGWPLANKIYQTVVDIIDDIATKLDTREDAAEVRIGFSEKGSITGEVSDDNREDLQISAIPSQVKQIRLSGKSFTDFTGKAWVDRDTSEARDSLMDTISFWASLDEYTDKEKDYARRTKINISYHDIISNHIFMPVKSLPLSHDLRSDDYMERGGDIVWPERRSDGSIYAVSYYLLNKDNHIFDEYLEKAVRPSKDRYNSAERLINADSLEGCSYEDYLAHAGHINEIYKNAPALSPELRSYMDKVYEGAETKIEKIKRLTDMLRGFEYTESPGALPDSVQDAGDFLDYFVLKSRRGFCSHFATAFVLLARAEGIPARYVQGYLAETKGRSSILVNSSAAHAWPEVYFEGAGWIPYEPTPAYESRSYWNTDSFWTDDPESPDDISDENIDIQEEEPPEETSAVFDIPWYGIVIPIGVGLVFIILAIVIAKMISSVRFGKLDEEDRFISLCKQNIRIISFIGFKLYKNETLHEFLTRLNDAGLDAVSFIEEYERYLYKGEISEDALRIVT